MKKNKLLLFILSIVFVFAIATETPAQGVLWLGTKRLNAEFFVEVAKGNVPGHSVVHKYGHGAVGTTAEAICISTDYQTPTVATALEIVSDDAADALDDTGAHEYTIWGIDANYNEVIQVVAAHATTGLTAVPIPISLLRVYRWKVTGSGVYASNGTGSHVGKLTIRDVSDTPIWTQIDDVPYPQAQSEISCYTVPDGFRAYIVEHDLDIDSAKSVDVMLMVRAGIDTITAPFTPMQTKGHYVGMKGHAVTPFEIPQGPFLARSDIIYMGKVASGTADVSVHFTLLIVADGY